MKFIYLCICFLLISFVSSLFQVANFPLIPGIKSGDHKAILTRLPANSNLVVAQTYNRTFSSTPIVAIGLVLFEIQAGINLSFTAVVSGITTIGFQNNITSYTDTNINQLLYTYIAVESSAVFGSFVLSVWDLSGNNSVTNSSRTQLVIISPSVNLSNTIIVKAFIRDFSMVRFNNGFSLKIDSKLNSSTLVQTKLKTNCTVTAISYYIYWVDKTILQQTQTYYLDPGFATSQYRGNTSVEFNVSQANFNYYNFMRGASWISFNASASDTLFSIGMLSFPFTTATNYNYASANLLHWRQRVCPTSTYFYVQSQTRCYDTCPAGFAGDVTLRYCVPCSYTCQSCNTDGSTCTNCPTGVNRIMANGTCNCINGYYDVGNSNVTCELCDYTCKTCVQSRTKCLTCDTTRDLINATCPCKSRLFDAGSQVCSSCHYSCLSCISSSTTCLSCSLTSNRILVLTSCRCKSGFQQPAVAAQTCVASALVCSQNCLTCQSTSTNCTGCDAAKKRQISSAPAGSCVCKFGYQSDNNVDTCTQICGDGYRFQYECDDGNNVNGDGCSSQCTIQTDFSCDLAVQPNVCVYSFSYTITLISVNKRLQDNLIDLVFTITPQPPTNSIASLTQLPLTITNQSISNGQISLTVSYNSSIPLSSYAKLSLSTIPTTLNFQLKQDNRLKLNYYSIQDYNAYRAQVGLVWLFIAILWIVVIVSLVIYRNGLLIVLDYMVVVGVSWVGVEGLSNIGLFYHPLTYLKYIFWYNLKIKGQDGLLAYVNYGFILFVLPFVVFLVGLIVKKVRAELQMTPQTKKYLLIQLTYALLCFYSIIVMYGLTTQQYTKTYSTPISIGSIVLGIIYFVLFLIGGIYFIKNHYKFLAITTPIMPNKGPYYFIISLSIKLITILTYMLISIIHNLKYSPLIIASISTLTTISIILIRPYQNNIRLICNQIIITLIYLCYYLILQVTDAQWAGFFILIVLYIGLICNCILLVKQYKKQKLAKQAASADDDQISYDPDRDQHVVNNAIDMDFDPHKIIQQNQQNRMATIKKQPLQMVEKVENASVDADNYNSNNYNYRNYGDVPTIRRRIIEIQQQ